MPPPLDTQQFASRPTPGADMFARAADYLRSRQTPQGGFCFYRAYGIEEPNLFDTYHAVAALVCLGQVVPHRAAVLDFLRGAASDSLPALYYHTRTLASLGCGDQVDTRPIDRLALDLPPRTLSTAARLRHAHEVVALKRRFTRLDGNAAATMAAQVRTLQTSGGFGDKPNLEDTSHALSVLAGLGLLDGYTVAATRVFVDVLQIGQFGFTLTADSLTPGLNVICAGIRCCALLGLPVRFGPNIARFIAACQADTGGFMRVPGALPEIESTHQALVILQSLSGRCDGHEDEC